MTTAGKATAPPLDAASVGEAGLPEVPFPGGETRPEFRVVFDEKAHASVLAHAAETSDVELCGILVGRVRRDRHGPYLAVAGSIRGEHAQNEGAQVKLTHATWDHVHKVKDERWPDDAIVGWYHTHPGFGIFLSSMDLFIHEFFFNTAAQIAHVVDPRSGEEGIFVWEAGKVARARRFWVGRSEKAAAGGPAVAASTSTSTSTSTTGEGESDGGFGLWRGGLAVVCGALLGFLLARALLPLELRLARDDLLRSEVRQLVGDAAQVLSLSAELKPVERRLDRALEAIAGAPRSPIAPTAAADLLEVRGALRALVKEAGLREDAIARAVQRRAGSGVTIEDELRVALREVAAARQLAIETSLLVVQSRLDAIRAGGREITAEERDALRRWLERALLAELRPDSRQAVVRQFPELYPPPEKSDKPPEPKR